MIKEVEIKVFPNELENEALIQEKVLKKCGPSAKDAKAIKVIKRSIDARGERPVYVLRVAASIGEAFVPEPAILAGFKDVSQKPHAIIIGAGPAGYFAALELIESGIKPIVFDRGKDVQDRRRDLRAIQQFGQVDPHSNYCFGEGGAGTYSDGKLYTRSHKRGSILKALKLLVEHGADSDILVDAHPHIGSNKLPKIVANIRATITKFGGQVIFNSHVTDLIIQNKKIKGVIVNNAEEYLADSVILATGHSARDIFHLLHEKGIRLEAKPFALGVRIEHPQTLIDKIQYNQFPREEGLPASSYRLACQVDDHGVYSFCMCPGGLIVPAATAPGEIVVNGMSLSRRDSPFANSGTVTEVTAEDLEPFHHHGVFSGLYFQEKVEKSVFETGDGSQRAPAQRLTDFVQKKNSLTLPDTSYIPGIFPAPLHQVLPAFIFHRLKQGVLQFGKKMKGYYTEDAVVVAPESRTSSPIRIPRDSDTLMHNDAEGLFPCGEGAGYAGGIISAAMDGQKVASAVAQFIQHQKASK